MKYCKTSTKPTKFRSQIKFMNFSIRIKKYTNHKFLNTNKKCTSMLWTTLQEDNQNNDNSTIAPPL